MSPLVFLDANVFMYAAGSNHPYKTPCLNILSDVESGVLTAAVNTEILQELLYRYSHINLAEKGIQLCRSILKYPLTILPVTAEDARQAVDLFDDYHARGLKPRDAIHAVTVRNNGISQLISTDKDFDQIPFLNRVDPVVYVSDS